MTESEKSINTIPTGVWETSRLKVDKKDIKTDLQGNGYPPEKTKESSDINHCKQ